MKPGNLATGRHQQTHIRLICFDSTAALAIFRAVPFPMTAGNEGAQTRGAFELALAQGGGVRMIVDRWLKPAVQA